MSRSIAPIVCCILLLAASSASAFNITRILGQYSDYSTFNELLSKSGLATDINHRGTITLLAVPNDAVGDLTSKSDDVLKRVLSTHVILDYYDPMKLQKMKDKTAKMTTMFQQSGKAAYDQGFLNCTAKDGSFVFGSAVVGAQRDSKLEKSVMNQPYNISILSISQPIVTPGLDGTMAPISAPPPKVNAPKSSPPAKSPAAKEEEVADSPSEQVAESPEKETEAPAPAPSKDTATLASSPDADSPPADAAPAPSSAGKLQVSFGLFVVLASMVVAY